MNLYIDIETVPTDDPQLIADIEASVTPPKNYSKPETIAKWNAEDKPALVADAIHRTSLDGGLGKIVCIGYAYGDEQPRAKNADSEFIVIAQFFEYTELIMYKYETLVGHNLQWDLRFLYQRAVVHGLQPPPQLLKAMKAKAWDECLADTMLMWNPERDKKISLDKLCRILGIESPKRNMTGADVWHAYKEGRLDDIAEYCRGDVNAMRACYERLTFARVREAAHV